VKEAVDKSEEAQLWGRIISSARKLEKAIKGEGRFLGKREEPKKLGRRSGKRERSKCAYGIIQRPILRS